MKLSLDCVFSFLGVSSGISDDTYFYDHQAKEWLDGPNLIQKRAWHGIGIVFDEVRKESLIIVTGGYDFFNWFNSTEVLINNEWTVGKNSLTTILRAGNYFAGYLLKVLFGFQILGSIVGISFFSSMRI